jgi:hypothetical protein
MNRRKDDLVCFAIRGIKVREVVSISTVQPEALL